MDQVQTILKNIRYANIATVKSNGDPWNTPVYYVYDSDNTLYWWSDNQSLHSQNITLHPQVAITIYASTVPEGEGVGVYFLANAKAINEADNSKILGLYNSFATVFKLKEEDVTGDAPTRFYSAKPLRIWINGESERNGKYIDVREEVL